MIEIRTEASDQEMTPMKRNYAKSKHVVKPAHPG
jgi:hypothetical protein